MWYHTASMLCQYHNAHADKKDCQDVEFFHPLEEERKVKVDGKTGLKMMAALAGIDVMEDNRPRLGGVLSLAEE